MVAVRRETRAGADVIWRVLANGWLYPSWVVGAARMRDVDAGWPGEGAKLHHSVGAWPALIEDTTEVMRSVPERELLLRGRVWPLGEANIRLRLQPRDGIGCVIVMEEDVVSGPTKLLPQPLRAVLIAPRNVEALRRLAYIAEGGGSQT